MATAQNTQNTKKRTYITWLTIAFMMVAAVASIRSLPAMAVYGLGSIMLFLIPAVVFFIPVALVASELGTGWNGGIYGWVKQAYGERLGFFVIWFLWIEVVVWYPSVLGFAASTLAYMFNPDLANNGLFTCISPSTIRTSQRSTIRPTDAILSGRSQAAVEMTGEHSDIPYPCAMEIPRLR